MDIKASDVKALREKTGAGMMECKKALQQCNGDAAEAEKYLKEKGLAAVEKRSDRATSEGIIVVQNTDKNAVMIEMTCETDFVAKNDEFIAVGDDIAKTALDNGITEITEELNGKMLDLATRVRENMSLTKLINIKAGDDEYISKYIHSDKKTGVVIVLKAEKAEMLNAQEVKDFAYDCCLHAAAFVPRYVVREDVDAAYLKEQEEIFRGQVADMDKPENVKDGIVKGKINKHLSEICFMDQPFVKDDKLSVSKKMAEVGKATGGKLTLSKLVIYQLGVNA